MNKTPYEWFWVGKTHKVREAVEEYLEILKNRQLTQQDIANKYGVTPLIIQINISELIKEKLINIYDGDYISNSKICDICHKSPSEQTHHIKYNPEVTINICNSCHQLIHSRGTGACKGTKKRPYNTVLRKKTDIDLPWATDFKLANKLYSPPHAPAHGVDAGGQKWRR